MLLSIVCLSAIALAIAPFALLAVVMVHLVLSNVHGTCDAEDCPLDRLLTPDAEQSPIGLEYRRPIPWV